MVAALAVFLLHAATSWGYIGVYWGDGGRWLYEVDRFANGARLYQDVFWGFPPLGMWLVGGAARLIGSDLTQIWVTTASIAALVAVVYGLVVSQLLPRRLAVPVAFAGMALGATYASHGSLPLVSGTYCPAVPVAVLFAFTQLAVFLREWRRPTLLGAAAVGALGGLGVLTKHDVWFVCGLLTVATAFASDARAKRAVVSLLAFAAVLASGLTILAIQHGVAALPHIFTGFGLVQEFGGLFLPNLAQFVIELGALGIALAAAAAIAWVSGALPRRGAIPILVGAGFLTLTAAAVWLTKAEAVSRAVLANGQSPYPTLFEGSLLPVAQELGGRLRRAVAALRFELLRHVFPLMLSLLVLAFTVRRRRLVPDQKVWRLLVVLLLAIVALRARRMLSFSEWSALMLEVPVYGFAFITLWKLPQRVVARAVTLGCLLLLLPALLAHRRFGYGLGSRRGVFPLVQTARGGVRLSANLAATYRDVRDLALLADSSGRRPLLSFGYSAGHNYLVGRPGVGALTHGFRISRYPTADSAFRVAQAQHDRLILIDSRAYNAPNPVPAFSPWRWQPRMERNLYLREDRPLFDRLLVGCRQMALPDRRTAILVYDCAAAPVSVAKSLTRGTSS